MRVAALRAPATTVRGTLRSATRAWDGDRGDGVTARRGARPPGHCGPCPGRPIDRPGRPIGRAAAASSLRARTVFAKTSRRRAPKGIRHPHPLAAAAAGTVARKRRFSVVAFIDV